MAWVVAASSLFYSLNTLRPAEKAELDELVYAESGLSLNPHTVRKRQNLQTLLEEHPLVDKEIILWHDVLNNSLSKHRTNANTLYPLDDLISYLQSKRHRFKAIIYCRRTRTTDIFDSLMRTGILIVPTTKLISRGKRQDPALVRQYLEVHQSSELELKSLRVVLTHRENLPGIFSKIRARTQKPSQGRRKAKARREETTTDVSLPSAERARIG